MRRGLLARILIPAMALFTLGILCLMTYVSSVARRNVIEASVANSKRTIAQFKALRKYYTDNVTSKVAKTGTLHINFDHESRADTIPLPATMIHDLSRNFEADPTGIRLRLYSAYPFPNRAGRMLDKYETESMSYLERDPAGTPVKVEIVDGRESVRIAIADKMTLQSCVDCHNSRADSPKRDWKLGDVRGALEVIAPIEAELKAESRMMYMAGGISLACLAMVGFFLWWFLRNRVVSSIAREAERLDVAAQETEMSASSMSEASRSLAEGASRQAAFIQETSASSLEVLTLATNNAANSSTAAGAMSRVDLQFKSSQQRPRRDERFYPRNRPLRSENIEDHQDHRRRCVPNQYPGPQCRRRSGAGR
jgi:methyl-accepting chemotaxis protein